MSMQSLFYDFGDLGQPFRAFDLLAKEMTRLATPDVGNREQARGEPRKTRAYGASPEVSAWEKDGTFFLTATLPGVAKDDVSITVEQNTITVSAKRELPAIEGYELRARERRAFAFERTFELPAPIAADKVEASLENGVLTVSLPKAQAPKAVRPLLALCSSDPPIPLRTPLVWLMEASEPRPSLRTRKTSTARILSTWLTNVTAG